MKGKLSIQQGEERHSGNFRWRQQHEEFAIEVWGPLGQGRVHLHGDAHTLALLDAEGTVVRQGPSEALMRAELGWYLPIAVMTAWVKGEPDPEMPVEVLNYDAEDRLQSFEQAGWRIEFARFRDQGGQWLPGRIDVTRTETRIRLVIAHWEMAEEQI